MASRAGSMPRWTPVPPAMPPPPTGPPPSKRTKLPLRVVTEVNESLPHGVYCVNEYAFLCHLGRGSYADVILARSCATGRLHALKCFSKSRLLKKRVMTRLDDGGVYVETALDKVQQEILLMRRLGCHPHIVHFDAVLSSLKRDELYYVMDVADAGVIMSYDEDSGRFKSLVPGEGPLPAGRPYPLHVVAHIMTQLVAAIHHCHTVAHVAHRDIKPENVLATHGGIVLLSDFGVGKAFHAGGEEEPHAGGGGSGGGSVASTPASSPSGPGGSGLGQRRLSPTSLVMSSAVVASPGGPLQSSYHVPGFAPLPPSADGTGDGGVGDAVASTACDGMAGASGVDASAAAPPLPLDWVTDTAGSFMYLPPEACTGDAGYRAFPADMWALGVCMYNLAFGSCPFGAAADTTMSMFDSICNDPLAFPYHQCANPIAAAGNDSFRSLLEGLLHRDPERRLTAMAALNHPFLSTYWSPHADGDEGGVVVLPPTFTFPAMSFADRPPYLSARGLAGHDSTVVKQLLRQLITHPSPATLLGLEEHGMPGASRPPLPSASSSPAAKPAALTSGGGSGASTPSTSASGGMPRTVSAFTVPSIDASTDSGMGGEEGEGDIVAPVVKHGWLWKRGRIVKTWKRRYFVLQGDDLRYYAQPPPHLHPASGATPSLPPSTASTRRLLLGGKRSSPTSGCGKVSLRVVVTVAPAYKVDKPHRFFVATPARTLYLQADDHVDMVEWIKVFKVYQEAGVMGVSVGGMPSLHPTMVEPATAGGAGGDAAVTDE